MCSVMLHLALLIQACAVIHSHATAKQSRVAQEAGKIKEYYPPSAPFFLFGDEKVRTLHYKSRVCGPYVKLDRCILQSDAFATR